MTDFTHEIKKKMLAELKEHREADQLIQGTYWSDGRGCAVGCLTGDPDGGHEQFPDLFGLPVWFALLIDDVFEGLPYEEAVGWPERVIAAIPPLADFGGLEDRLAVRRLYETVLPLQDTWPEEVGGQVAAAINGVITALKSGEGLEAAADAAAATVVSASSADAATETASSADAARSAWWSAERAAASARAVALPAADVAESAAWAGARAAAWAARTEAWAAAGSAGAAAWRDEADRITEELERLAR